MAGYTRQSVADIIANAVIKAAPVNAEFNSIRDAFSQTTGHAHDGTSAEGAYVPLIADPDGNNKVVVDTINNRVSFYAEVSGAPVEQVRVQDGAVVPVTDDDVDLGAVGAEFKNLYIDGIGYIDSVVITGGTIDGTVIGGTTPAAATLTNATATGNLSVTGTSTLIGNTTITYADINAGTVDNTNIGATTPSSANFTTVTTSGQATLASVDINGGAIDGTAIGSTVPTTIKGTTITGTSIVGPLTGNVTGNVAGNVTGNLTGNVTGNVTASTGTSSFTDVTINGTLNMNAGTAATITNLTAPINVNDAATKGYVDTSVASLVDAAPGTLDTLNELAAALGDDPSFSTTITTSIATKLPLSGGTMSGAIAMGTNKITGLGNPTAAQDAATQGYVTGNFLGLTGGTLSGAVDVGSSKVTTTYVPVNGPDLTNKTYVDSILGSAVDAATSAAEAATSATNAATSETNAATSASAALSAETNAAASYDAFDDRYLGSKASDPTLDNDGDALLTGTLYWNTTSSALKIYDGAAWNVAAFDVSGALVAANNLSDLANAATARTNLGLGTAATTASTDYLAAGAKAADSELLDGLDSTQFLRSDEVLPLPAIRPSLNLDFANTNYLDSRITFSRSTTATYYDQFGTLQTAAFGEARFDHDPATGEAKGLLIEAQRTNLLTYSEQFDNAAWVKGNLTVAVNSAIAPDGTPTADTIIEEATTQQHLIFQPATVTNGNTYTASFFVKDNGWGGFIFQMGAGGPQGIFDLLTAEASTSLGATKAKMFALNDGWFYCTVTGPANTSTNMFFYKISGSYTGDGVSGIYIWGAQLEAGSFPTSYIKTEAATATRVADDVSMTGTNFSDWYNQSEGTFVADAAPRSDESTDSSYVTVSDGTNTNRVVVQTAANNTVWNTFLITGGVSQGASTVTVDPVTSYIVAIAYASNDFIGAAGGTLATADTVATVPSVDQLRIGSAVSNSDIINTHFKRLSYYPRRLTNAELVALTEV